MLSRNKSKHITLWVYGLYVKANSEIIQARIISFSHPFLKNLTFSLNVSNWEFYHSLLRAKGKIKIKKSLRCDLHIFLRNWEKTVLKNKLKLFQVKKWWEIAVRSFRDSVQMKNLTLKKILREKWKCIYILKVWKISCVEHATEHVLHWASHPQFISLIPPSVYVKR